MIHLLRCNACGKIDRCFALDEDGYDPTDTDLVEVDGFNLCPCDPVAPGAGFRAIQVEGEWCEVPACFATQSTAGGQLDLFAEVSLPGVV